MTVGDRRAIERPQAAGLIGDWIAANAHGGIPYGRPQHPLGEIGELGGLRVDAALKRALTNNGNRGRDRPWSFRVGAAPRADPNVRV